MVSPPTTLSPLLSPYPLLYTILLHNSQPCPSIYHKILGLLPCRSNNDLPLQHSYEMLNFFACNTINLMQSLLRNSIISIRSGSISSILCHPLRLTILVVRTVFRTTNSYWQFQYSFQLLKVTRKQRFDSCLLCQFKWHNEKATKTHMCACNAYTLPFKH